MHLRFLRALFNKKILFFMSRSYLFHLKKELTFRFPILAKCFQNLKTIRTSFSNSQTSAAYLGRRRLEILRKKNHSSQDEEQER